MSMRYWELKGYGISDTELGLDKTKVFAAFKKYAPADYKRWVAADDPDEFEVEWAYDTVCISNFYIAVIAAILYKKVPNLYNMFVFGENEYGQAIAAFSPVYPWELNDDDAREITEEKLRDLFGEILDELGWDNEGFIGYKSIEVCG